jgi:hypothetical protein
VLCFIWGPRGTEWRDRKRRQAVIAEQQQRLADARTAAYLATFPSRTPSGVAPDQPAVVRAQSSASLPAYGAQAGHGEVVLGIGGAISREPHTSELRRCTDSAVTLTAVPPYVFTTASAAGSSREPPTPTTPTTPGAPGGSNAPSHVSAAPNGATPTVSTVHAPSSTPTEQPPTPTGPPDYRRTLSSTSLPRALSTSSLTRLRAGVSTLPNRPGTPPGSPSTPTRARSGTPTPAYTPSLAPVPQAALAPDPSPVLISAAPRSPRRARMSPLVPSAPGTFSLL